MGGKVCDVLHGLKPALMMVTVQVALAGVNICYKLAANEGVSLRVLIAYRFIFAAATIVPLALVVERKTRPKMTCKIALQSFASALFGLIDVWPMADVPFGSPGLKPGGSLAQNLYAMSLAMTSATFAAAITNLVPAMTFILAIIFRMEGLGFRTMAGKAKVVGTLMCIGGAMVLTFFKGFEINIWSTHFDLMHMGQRPGGGHVAAAHHKSGANVAGLLLALACCAFSSLSLIIQTKMSEKYPCHYSSTALISSMGAIQATVFALCTEKDWSQWKLGWNLELFMVAYMGIIASGLMWVFIMACVRMRGPLFVSVFNPLLLVLVALAGSLFLNEKLHLGSVVGAVIIIGGLYSVLWGKSQEIKKISRLAPSKSFTDAIKLESEYGENVKGFVHANNNVMAVTPNFIPDSEILEEEEEDIEAISTCTPQPRSLGEREERE